MIKHLLSRAVTIACLFCISISTYAQLQQPKGVSRMNVVAKGTFEVSLKPQQISDVAISSALGRMSIDKQFAGGLTGTSKGEMLSTMGNVKGSAGYVAIERVTGKIGSKSGAFSLQHNGIMNRGTPTLWT